MTIKATFKKDGSGRDVRIGWHNAPGPAPVVSGKSNFKKSGGKRSRPAAPPKADASGDDPGED